MMFLDKYLTKSECKILFISTEDDEEELHLRFNGIIAGTAQKYGISEDLIWSALGSNLHLVSLAGRTQPLIDKNMEPTSYFSILLSTIKLYPGVDLIVIDTRSRFSGVDENSNAAVSQELSMYEILSNIAGKSSILIIHHTSKAALRANSQGGYVADQTTARGASAFTDNSRLTIDMALVRGKEVRGQTGASEHQSLVRLSITKCKYGPLPQKPFYLLFDQNGLYDVVEEDSIDNDFREYIEVDNLHMYLKGLSAPTTVNAIAESKKFGSRSTVTKLIGVLKCRGVVDIENRGNKKLITVVMPPTVVTAPTA